VTHPLKIADMRRAVSLP